MTTILSKPSAPPRPAAKRHNLSVVQMLFAVAGCLMLQFNATAQSTNAVNTSNLTGVAAERALHERIPVCHSFDCSVREIVTITPLEWQEVIGWFKPGERTPEQERQQIRHAIGWLEVVVARYTPTHVDVAGNLPPGVGKAGQLDCIDESHNTTTYLRLLEKANVFRHHTVIERAYRRAIFDQHWSGQIEENETGQRFVVDSWFQDNGFLPHVEPVEQWKSISFFSSAYSSTVAQNRTRRE